MAAQEHQPAPNITCADNIPEFLVRLLWLSHFVPFPPTGGARLRTYHLLREAASRHEIHLIALDQPGAFASSDDRVKALDHLGSLTTAIEVHPITTSAGPFGRAMPALRALVRGSPYAVEWLSSRPFEQSVSHTIGAGPWDLIHIDTCDLAPAVMRILKASRVTVPFIINHHNVESHMLARRGKRASNPIKARYFAMEAAKERRLEQDACARSAANLMVSTLDSERLLGIVPQARVAIVPNGVDTDYFRPHGSDPATHENAVFVGGLNWYPNLEAAYFLVREVAPQLAAVRPHSSITIIGKDPPDELRLAARGSNVVFTGFVPDIRPYLRRATVYVCPMFDGGGTRLKVLDALSSGVPMVATTMAMEGLPAIPHVHYIPAYSGPEFASAIVALFDDHAKRQRLAGDGRALVEQAFAWPRVGECLEAAYRSAATLPLAPPVT